VESQPSQHINHQPCCCRQTDQHTQHAVNACCSRLLLWVLPHHSACHSPTHTTPAAAAAATTNLLQTQLNICAVPRCADLHKPESVFPSGCHHLLDGPCTRTCLLIKTHAGPVCHRALQPLPGCGRGPQRPRHVHTQAHVGGQDPSVQHQARHITHPAVGAAAHRGLREYRTQGCAAAVQCECACQKVHLLPGATGQRFKRVIQCRQQGCQGSCMKGQSQHTAHITQHPTGSLISLKRIHLP
jgi:hypothetical protein